MNYLKILVVSVCLLFVLGCSDSIKGPSGGGDDQNSNEPPGQGVE